MQKMLIHYMKNCKRYSLETGAQLKRLHAYSTRIFPVFFFYNSILPCSVLCLQMVSISYHWPHLNRFTFFSVTTDPKTENSWNRFLCNIQLTSHNYGWMYSHLENPFETTSRGDRSRGGKTKTHSPFALQPAWLLPRAAIATPRVKKNWLRIFPPISEWRLDFF